MNKQKVLLSTLLCVITFILFGCAETTVVTSSKENTVRSSVVTYKEIPSYSQEITISAIGDILIHSPVYMDAKTEGGYDFIPMLESVKDTLEASTISVANQETMIGGEELGLSTYPSFNSPFEVGDALKAVGVNVVTLANNHTLDRGEDAIQNAIEQWETIDMMYTGAYKDQRDRENLRVYETEEGISVAFLSYTYGTNGIPVPEGKDYLVNLIDKNRIAEEVALAKEEADVVTLSLHFGNENERMPNEEQKELVQFAADQGVDIVFGHHPHVLQPMEWVTGKDGNETFVMYSLGNFISNQQELYQRIGGILNLSITKTVTGDEKEIEIHSPTFIPTYVTFTDDWTNYEVKPMYQLTNDELKGASDHYNEIKAHLSQWMPELEFIEE
ncbi:CapA family protein [Oceanobacillus polygoni]|uniref:Poly-gamma-glutamate synthesis protein (Capsule biosynthesis protein) n=1 Tax=Oceanobacillus polygoni TaxID=1235259 RepID=A0A9X0YVW9_9BACI|nr:CapA family protein [Oceanobacillus polygoni]MBP2079838.1 poly-gamma-glutamate synthesis protein (capsule biosynthesis protein) [Oceanobacillus polygoni]